MDELNLKENAVFCYIFLDQADFLSFFIFKTTYWSHTLLDLFLDIDSLIMSLIISEIDTILYLVTLWEGVRYYIMKGSFLG